MEPNHAQKPTYSVDPAEVLRFQIDRNIVVLFKTYLVMLEDLNKEHDAALGKLYNALPEQYKPFVDLADYFTDSKVDQLRSKVLGAGNDARRAVEEIIKNFNISIK